MLKQLLLLGIIFIIIDAGFLYLMSNNFPEIDELIKISFTVVMLIKFLKYGLKNQL